MKRRAFAVALAGALALGSCKARPGPGQPTPAASGSSAPVVQNGSLVEIDLSSDVPESTASGGLFPLPATRTFTGLLRALERASGEPETAGYFVRLGAGEINWAQGEELGRFFAAARKRKLPVVCHAHGYSNKTIGFAARACDEIWLSPGGSVDAVGIAAQVVYMKSALDKLNVSFDILHMGKYKSAAEPLTRDGPSDEARESLTATLASIRGTWLDSSETARKNAGLRDNFEHGPWSAEDSKQRGLVDSLGFESEAREHAKKRTRAEKTKTVFGPEHQSGSGFGIADLVRVIAGGGDHGGGHPHVAVLVAEGGISMEAEGSVLEGGGITFKAMQKVLGKLGKDDAVKAVVLRIDSPGGSALASDLIWHDLDELRRKKPVVTSVGAMAASGGYYLACATNKIVAERTSIVGSIGVVGGKVVLDRALAGFGFNAVTFPASPEPGAAARAAYLSPFAAWDDPTRERVRAQMSAIYELFLDRCSRGRKIPKEKLRESAEGRIWSGEQGKARGLVDSFGGLGEALTLARSLGGLPADAPVVVEGAREGLLERLMLGDDANADEVAHAAERLQKQPLLPVPRSIQPFARAFEGLARGEAVAAALPFALDVR